ncbi:fumarate reductase subunit FrdD [Pasteurellaceae bacterium HPA106]|uniref:fumarate reductase subunit FrdD n=1 Tax=Spirabiliibacterium pneumoniae TaxID=221400 RepID=UPI001AAC4D70|nr:fumarate reductase subunit FrdD [Spirabiliibacterium pneumoniae]MBE2896778.1 fumarate reductase subunit FrdD [Spirabiliibacterium pneumoniae]
MNQSPKRSNEPVVWLLFGTGGTVSAIVFPVLALILLFLYPLGLVSPENMVAFAHSFLGKLILLVVAIFPMWCGMHRVHHGLHDFKVHLPASGVIFYGLAALYSVITFFAVINI